MSWEDWRNRQYKNTYCEIAFKILSEGKTKSHVCRELKVSKSILLQWMKEFPDFNEAVHCGLTSGESVFRDKVEKHAWQPSKEVNNGLIKLMASNVYGIQEEPSTIVNVNQTNNSTTEEDLKKRGIPIPKVECDDIEDQELEGADDE